MSSKPAPLCLTLLVLFASACILATPFTPTLAPAGQATDTSLAGTTPATEVSSTLPPPTPTAAPTATVYPPVFNPDAVGDNRVLQSFVLKITDHINYGGGDLRDYWDSIGYIKEPVSAYHTGRLSYSGPAEAQERDSYYLIGGLLYSKSFREGGYYVHFLPVPDDVNYQLLDAADMRRVLFLIESAQFVAQEDCHGIPANHFIFDETNLGSGGGFGIVQKAEGDLYLAQGENYLLYFHLKVTGSEASRDLTEELTSINQLTEIALPADFPVFNLDPAIPFPEGTLLWSDQTDEARDYDLYDYFVPDTVSYEDFLDFYRNLASTSPWTLSEIGKIDGYLYCESRDCVTLTNGNVRVILYKSDLCVSTMPQGYVCILAVYYK